MPNPENLSRINATSIWTDDVVERALKLWNEGFSGSQIAQLIGRGLTRCAVLGKLHRISAPHRITTVSLRPGPSPAKPRRPPRPSHSRPTIRVIPARPEPPPMPLTHEFARPWTERQTAQCAFPVWGQGADTFSCCAPCGEATYCAAHRKVMVDWEATKRAKRSKIERIAA